MSIGSITKTAADELSPEVPAPGTGRLLVARRLPGVDGRRDDPGEQPGRRVDLRAAQACRVGRLDPDRPGLPVLPVHRRRLDHPRPLEAAGRSRRPPIGDLQDHPSLAGHLRPRPVPGQVPVLPRLLEGGPGPGDLEEDRDDDPDSRRPPADRALLPGGLVDLPQHPDQGAGPRDRRPAGRLLAADDLCPRPRVRGRRPRPGARPGVVPRSPAVARAYLQERLRPRRAPEHPAGDRDHAARRARRATGSARGGRPTRSTPACSSPARPASSWARPGARSSRSTRRSGPARSSC